MLSRSDWTVPERAEGEGGERERLRLSLRERVCQRLHSMRVGLQREEETSDGQAKAQGAMGATVTPPGQAPFLLYRQSLERRSREQGAGSWQ